MVTDFHLGQIVISDFSGPRRSMYDVNEYTSTLLPTSTDNLFIYNNEIGIVLDLHEESKKFIWLKLLTSSGAVGYIPSIWVNLLNI